MQDYTDPDLSHFMSVDEFIFQQLIDTKAFFSADDVLFYPVHKDVQSFTALTQVLTLFAGRRQASNNCRTQRQAMDHDSIRSRIKKAMKSMLFFQMMAAKPKSGSTPDGVDFPL